MIEGNIIDQYNYLVKIPIDRVVPDDEGSAYRYLSKVDGLDRERIAQALAYHPSPPILTVRASLPIEPLEGYREVKFSGAYDSCATNIEKHLTPADYPILSPAFYLKKLTAISALKEIGVSCRKKNEFVALKSSILLIVDFDPNHTIITDSKWIWVDTLPECTEDGSDRFVYVRDEITQVTYQTKSGINERILRDLLVDI